MSVRTQAALQTQINTLIDDNSSGNITPSDVRSVYTDINDTVHNPQDDVDFGGSIRTAEILIDNNTLGIRQVGATGSLPISGGAEPYLGSNFWLYGNSHASEAYDIKFRTNTTNNLAFDYSASTWTVGDDLQLVMDMTTADNGYFDFQASIGADAVSAVSSLTTLGPLAHCVQIRINGGKYWLAAYLNPT